MSQDKVSRVEKVIAEVRGRAGKDPIVFSVKNVIYFLHPYNHKYIIPLGFINHLLWRLHGETNTQ